MSEMEPSAASPFRELRGDYVDHAGQQINLQGYLDYFEPLGSSLSRLPDGAGGPFVYRFSANGRTIGALGWVVSAAARRYGAWKLWGMWTDRSIPAVALPLFWPDLADPSRIAGVVDRANRDAAGLFDRKKWPALCHEIGRTRLQNASFREILKAELSHAYAAPLPHRQPIEIELTSSMLDLLPWLYLLGPVDPSEAQLQPSRFNGGGYQYILTDREPALRDTEIPREVEEIVDSAAHDVFRGWKKAHDIRTWRGRPAPRPAPAPPPREPRRWEEEDAMPARKPPASKPSIPIEKWMPIWTAVYQIAVLALLIWIALEVRGIRKARVADTVTAPETTTTVVSTAPAPAPVSPAVEEPESPGARITRIAQALVTRPPQGIRVNRDAVTDDASLARAAIEVFLRRNSCYARSEAVDGKISAAEQRAIRNCSALRTERLVNSRGEIDEARAVAWLERTLS